MGSVDENGLGALVKDATKLVLIVTKCIPKGELLMSGVPAVFALFLHKNLQCTQTLSSVQSEARM